MRRKLLAGVCVVLFGVSGMAYSDDTTVTLDGNTSSSGFSIKDSSGTSIARFQGDGKVGIGTTAPGAKLDVAGDVKISADSTEAVLGTGMQQVSGGESILWYSTNLRIKTAATGGTGDRVSILSNGNVGIGTTAFNSAALLTVGASGASAVHLDVSAANTVEKGLRLYSNATTLDWEIASQATTRILSIGETAGANRLVIDRSGNVGIGTTEPSAVLDVAGGTIIRGSAGSGNTISLRPDDGNVGLQLTSGTSNGTPYIDFGNDATSDFDMRIILSGDDTLAIEGGSLSYTSDVRLKRNVTILEGAVEKIRSIRGVSFEWKDEKYGKGTQIGLIAQDVEKTLPELVHTNTDGYKSVTYDKLTAVLVEAVKEQQGTIAAQNEKIAMLEKKLSELSETMNSAIQFASVK